MNSSIEHMAEIKDFLDEMKIATLNLQERTAAFNAASARLERIEKQIVLSEQGIREAGRVDLTAVEAELTKATRYLRDFDVAVEDETRKILKKMEAKSRSDLTTGAIIFGVALVIGVVVGSFFHISTFY
jgi:hypothetical protein